MNNCNCNCNHDYNHDFDDHEYDQVKTIKIMMNSLLTTVKGTSNNL